MDFRGDSEYYLQVAVNFGPDIFCRELSQITPTVCVIITKNCKETSRHGLQQSIAKPLIVGRNMAVHYNVFYKFWLVPM